MKEQVCEFYQPTLSVSLNCGCYFCKEIAILFNNNETQALHSKRGGGLLAPPSSPGPLFHWGSLWDDHQHFLPVMGWGQPCLPLILKLQW